MHFYYNPDSLDNRRRYIPDSEANITGFINVWTDQEKVIILVPEEEDIQEQNKKSVRCNIVFVKYFDQKRKLKSHQLWKQ